MVDSGWLILCRIEVDIFVNSDMWVVCVVFVCNIVSWLLFFFCLVMLNV